MIGDVAFHLFAEFVTSLFDMDIEIVTPSRSLVDSSIKIADENDLTVYDSTYVALAKALDAEVVTADDELSQHSGATHIDSVDGLAE